MTCPLSLAAIVLLALVIFYSTKEIITFVAVGVLLMILFNFGKLEKFTGLSIDTEDTGIVRPLWGPLYPVDSKAQKEQHYFTMHGLPWCSPPLSPTGDGKAICSGRVEKKPEIHYSMNKI